MNSFEHELRRRLDERAQSLYPMADTDDLAGRIQHSRAHRRRVATALAGGACVVLFTTATAFALRPDTSSPVATEGDSAPATTEPAPATTAVAEAPLLDASVDEVRVATTTLPPNITPPMPPHEGPADPEAALDGIEVAVRTVYTFGAPEADVLAAIDVVDGLPELFAQIKAHPLYPDLATLQVSIDEVNFTSATSADIRVVFRSSDPRYPGSSPLYGVAVFEDGRWKMGRSLFCSSVNLISNVVQAGLQCPEWGSTGEVPATLPTLPPVSTAVVTTVSPETTVPPAP